MNNESENLKLALIQALLIIDEEILHDLVYHDRYNCGPNLDKCDGCDVKVTPLIRLINSFICDLDLSNQDALRIVEQYYKSRWIKEIRLNDQELNSAIPLTIIAPPIPVRPTNSDEIQILEKLYELGRIQRELSRLPPKSEQPPNKKQNLLQRLGELRSDIEKFASTKARIEESRREDEDMLDDSDMCGIVEGSISDPNSLRVCYDSPNHDGPHTLKFSQERNPQTDIYIQEINKLNSELYIAKMKIESNGLLMRKLSVKVVELHEMINKA